MQTSKQGIEFIERHEGVVLKAYRDPVGILTIGAGLTKASGVVTPTPGMVISRDEASRLLGLALQRNYEPRVTKAMSGANQHEFDAGVSFDFNTGAIDRATWVKLWRDAARSWSIWPDIETSLKSWRKGGGRILPGLVCRRDEEYQLLRHGIYRLPSRPVSPQSEVADIVIPLSQDEERKLVDELNALGYEAGEPGEISRAAVRRFQEDHDLTVDGIIGMATWSMVRRRSDASTKTQWTAAGSAASGTAATAPEAMPDWALWLVLAVVSLIALRLAWSYRDVVAAKVQGRLPKLAAKLRSV